MEQNPRYTSLPKNPDNPPRVSSESNHQVPKKRRDMVLTLGKTTLTNSDQTPTPTRFIRNCEEVGLFQDLRCDNPFEGAFRKAAEEVRTGAVVNHTALSFSLHGADDTLHTPHVFPGIAEAALEASEKTSSGAPPTDSKAQSAGRERVIKSEADTSLKISSPSSAHQNEVIVELNNEGFLLEKNKRGRSQEDRRNYNNNRFVPTEQDQQNDHNVQVLLKMPNGALLQISTTPVHQTNACDVTGRMAPLVSATSTNNTVILNTQALASNQYRSIPVMQDKTSIVKQKLKQALLSGLKPVKPANKVPINGNPQISLPTHGQAVGGVAKVKRVETAIIRRASSSTNSEEDANDEKRRRALERNRAAAMRCREKRKAWVTELRRRAELMTSTNQALLQEVASLRAEVARLKALLLTHRNCPVTLAAIANGGSGDGSAAVESDKGGAAVMMVISKKSIEPLREERPPATVSTPTLEGMSRMRERLSLDIEGARRAHVDEGVDLDSPLVRSDEVLSSVALTTTPNDPDKLVAFPVDEHMDIDSSDSSSMGVLDDGKALATPVIQLNPNAVLRSGSTSNVTCPSDTDYR